MLRKPDDSPAPSLPLDVLIGRCGAQVYLNRWRLAGPGVNPGVEVRYQWQVPSARLRNVLERAPGDAVPFVLGRGNRGVLASLGGKVLAGDKANRRIVPLGQADIPVELIRAALSGMPNVSLTIGAFYATASARKVMIYKRSEEGCFHGIFVETDTPGRWHADGQNLYREQNMSTDIVARWDEAEQQPAGGGRTRGIAAQGAPQASR